MKLRKVWRYVATIHDIDAGTSAYLFALLTIQSATPRGTELTVSIEDRRLVDRAQFWVTFGRAAS